MASVSDTEVSDNNSKSTTRKGRKTAHFQGDDNLQQKPHSFHESSINKLNETTTMAPSSNSQPNMSGGIDDADAAAGQRLSYTAPQSTYSMAPPISMGGMSTHPSDLEFFDDLVSEPVLVLGVDISHMDRHIQFIVCATGVFGFSLLYGYLQELISVQICNRQLGLFLAMMQFIGYTVLSFFLKAYVYETHQKKHMKQNEASGKIMDYGGSGSALVVPFAMYLGLSLLRAVDLAMTNLAMQYINYPAKTLMKSSRVVFTMIFGVFITRKKYQFMDYFVVLCMVAGLAIFMHADATSSAIFQPVGVVMLTVSLLCDGAISNMSESIMKNYGVGQDEFIFKMYSIALVAISAAAAAKGDLQLGMVWLMQPGTYDEMQQGVTAEEATWSVTGKITVIVFFSSMGFFGSSCSAAITKNFGALTMSITSTARKATTLFLSFFIFNNVCTMEHIVGVIIFISALTAKSLRRRKDANSRAAALRQAPRSGMSAEVDLEMQLMLHQDKLKRNARPKSKSPARGYGTPGRRPNASRGLVLGEKSTALVI
ncbi:Adenosine 3'-phospho 5'-phosphosulfate transporter 2 [Seminavis robusta]|uniref:Adenosine 3'-phospho 5'-phosphosulfate transporter 2 n=1 Tax=Seminavis robusta TaxID=568900 RepID=A0A9N8EMX3_9STRA|nr:Adenosine 3'-phospho 5'-phosphosulfate transporter 2 [Seminavis robusta]|eukprot:Sro1359_g265930.1 Adenosine 3'-phospho 5'-phosphosulfate transporter 2 (540) ;mRNA; f:4648-6267